MITSQNGMLTIPQRFCQLWQYLACNVEIKTFPSGVIGSMNRQRTDIKVTFVSFSLHARRFTVEQGTEYGNMLFSYFDIFIYVLSNFTLIQWLQSICSVAQTFQLLYQFWFGYAPRELRKTILIRSHALSLIHPAPNFLLLSTSIASLSQ